MLFFKESLCEMARGGIFVRPHFSDEDLILETIIMKRKSISPRLVNFFGKPTEVIQVRSPIR